LLSLCSDGIVVGLRQALPGRLLAQVLTTLHREISVEIHFM
jgi:hypothetical protein